jgi:hypothetical protein
MIKLTNLGFLNKEEIFLNQDLFIETLTVI